MYYIGTSGWYYPHWAGPFYPEGTPRTRFLAYYAAHFRTVELNNSFYRVPSEDAFRKWRDGVPPGFIFSIKANRTITHLKKLAGSGEITRDFINRAGALGEKLGPFLFQLPPGLKCDAARLESFLRWLPEGYRYVFEFRDPDWFADATFRTLAARNAAFCIYELAGRKSPETVTADFVYVRLHGPDGAYRGRYGENEIASWAKKARDWSEGGKDFYCYFDNDEEGYAPADAVALISSLGGRGLVK